MRKGTPPAESSPVWPLFVPDPQDRTLCIILPDGRMQPEHYAESGEIATPATFEDIANVLFAWDALAWVDDIDSLVDRYGDVILGQLGTTDTQGRKRAGVDLHVHPETGQIAVLAIQRLWPDINGRPCWQKRHIARAKAWPGGVANLPFLALLRRLFDACGVGVLATPAGLGERLIREQWRLHDLPRYHRPRLDCIYDLEKHAVGGRKEAFFPRQRFDAVYELDRSNGYAASSMALPAGTASLSACGDYSFVSGNDYRLPPGAVAAFHEVELAIDAPGLRHGDIAPFAVRDAQGQLSWPTTPGKYQTWLWHFEVMEVFSRYLFGDRIRPLRLGKTWWWPHESHALEPWAYAMDALRRQFDAEGTREGHILAGYVKAAIVAGIGRLGMSYHTSRVVHEDDSVEGDKQIQSEVFPNSVLYLHRERDNSRSNPLHWHRYILSVQNFDLYLQARGEWLDGNTIIATNVDGLFLERAPRRGVAPERATMGDYKRAEYHGYFRNPAPGVILAPDKVRTPGMAPAAREYLMRHGEDRDGEKARRAARRASALGNMRALNAAVLADEERLERLYERVYARERHA